MSKEIKKLIVKFLSKEANFDELQELEIWIKDPKNEAIFLEYIKTNVHVNSIMNKYDKDKAKENILKRIKKEKGVFYSRPIINKKFKYAIAASIVLLITIGLWFTNKSSITEPQFTEPTIVNNQIKIGTDKATLTLEDGTDVALVKGENYQTQNAVSNGEQIIYNNSTSRELVNNYLTTARGEQFQITLADGTRVWLNSETQLKYPVSFTDGESRQVELVYGEAYFDVSPSTNHNGSNFRVYHTNQEVEVLGTEFNIKAYKDETNIYTTLAEGEVSINNGLSKEILSPAQQSIINKATREMVIRTVDVYPETSWRKGIFSFKSKSLKEIAKVLSRWYDTDIIFLNKELEDIQFRGVLSKNQNIEDILITIKQTNFINAYEINKNTILIK